MKRLIYLIIFAALFSLTACGATGAPKVSDYFPYLENTYYEYECAEKNLYSYQVFNGYVKGGKVQRRVSAEDNARTEVFEIKSGELRLTYGDPSYYFYDDITGANSNVDVLIMKEPLEVGTKWQMDNRNDAEITNMAATVETPYKTFEEAMEITITTNDTGTIQKDYYVKGVGLVRSFYDVVPLLQQEDVVVAGEDREQFNIALKNLTTENPINVPVQLYSLNETMNEIETSSVDLQLSTNGDLKKELERLMGERVGMNPIISAETKVSSVDIVHSESKVTIDLSKEYTDYVATLPQESKGLNAQAIANFIGNFYGVDTVTITVGGKTLPEGTDLTVEKVEEPDTQYAPIVQ